MVVQSIPRNKLVIFIRNALAMDSMLCSVKLRSPRSTCPMYVQCIPLISASFS